MNAVMPLIDLRPPVEDMLSEVCRGLAQTPKRISSKYFYDARGSALFEQICAQPEYYLTRTELGILQQQIGAIAEALGPDVLLIEFGSGSGIKTERLLRGMRTPVAYVPIDISRSALRASAEALRQALPGVPIIPVCADFTQALSLPTAPRPTKRRVLFFPGSTLGNFSTDDALALLRRMRQVVGTGGAVLIGLDMKKSVERLEAAYNDAAGVTAEFTLNLLVRLNRELGADFAVDRFRHRARYNRLAGRIETHLLSQCRQQVSLDGQRFEFAAGEAMLVEYSAKYDQTDVERMASKSGLAVERVFSDAEGDFSLQLLSAV
ncbi:L-histidine N(alpha)-methyltransferase [Pseudomarimonas arenosa]|uniref:L-histidine N(Alpha)-methyltransferase n=1 Tax=Pseudomarimonas arenosa TaxID=2774145 RepID=A0AAW3ZM30_9GAMM|nr:L-histidine N(alpha)-methyltransferase [Pseudomarimonas arenosa]MBD8527116.1 L-histidine N(alpha)-methyltransferase [Pseudomarimonas arenosa]